MLQTLTATRYVTPLREGGSIPWLGLTFLLLTGAASVAAQEEPPPTQVPASDISPQIWLDYNPSWALEENLRLFGDIGVRWQLDSGGWWRLVIRPGVISCLENGICLMGGVGSFYTSNDVIPDTWELRPFQGARVTWPNWHMLPLQHLVRLEERFDFNTDEWTADASVRGRYRIGTFFRWGALQTDRYWRATTSVEAFLTLLGDQGQFQEDVRANVGLERSFSRNLRLLGEVTWQKRGLFFISDESVNDIYIRIRVFQHWGR